MSGPQFDYLDLMCPPQSSSCLLLLLLLGVFSSSLSSSLPPAPCASKFLHCRLRPGGVQDLHCYGRSSSPGWRTCSWRPGEDQPERSSTDQSERSFVVLVLQRNYCKVYRNVSGTSQTVSVFQKDLTVQVLQNADSAECSKAQYSAKTRDALRCGPPSFSSFRWVLGVLQVQVSWTSEDQKVVQRFTVRYREAETSSWTPAVLLSGNRSSGSVEGLNRSSVHQVQVRSEFSSECSQCPWSDAFTVPPELRREPVILNLQEAELGKRGCGQRTLSITWQHPEFPLVSGYTVTLWKTSGETPVVTMATPRPHILLLLSYSSYSANITAHNNASVSPATSCTINPRDGPGDGRLTVSVHHKNSFTVSWSDDLVPTVVCFSLEWRERGGRVRGGGERGGRVQHSSFHETKNNFRTLDPLPEPLRPFTRYSLTLGTRPSRDTCNLHHLNDSELTYGSAHFYLQEGRPDAPPSHLSISNVSQSSALLRWNAIKEEKRHGFIRGYVIHYRERGGREQNVTVDPSLSVFELRDLRGGAPYQVQISGFTSAGPGIRSPALFFRTNQQGRFDHHMILVVLGVFAAALVIQLLVMKRLKSLLWPNIPNPGDSHALKRMDAARQQELLEAVDTLTSEEWSTKSLQVFKKEEFQNSSPLFLVPLLQSPEDHVGPPEPTRYWTPEDHVGPPEPTRYWSPEDHQETTGGGLAGRTSGLNLSTPQTNVQNPEAFSSGYTTMEMFTRATTVSPQEQPDVDPDV